MNIRGAAFLGREALMIASIGAGRWRDYLDTYAQGEPFFRQPINDRTLMPAEIFIAFNEDLVQRFFGGDTRAYWTFGERAAHYALAQGQLKGLFRPGDLQVFLEYTPNFHEAYFDAGRLQLDMVGENVAELSMFDFPIQHVYLEYSVMGFAEGGLKLVGARAPSPERVRGFSKGDKEVTYRFHLD